DPRERRRGLDGAFVGSRDAERTRCSQARGKDSKSGFHLRWRYIGHRQFGREREAMECGERDGANDAARTSKRDLRHRVLTGESSAGQGGNGRCGAIGGLEWQKVSLGPTEFGRVVTVPA